MKTWIKVTLGVVIAGVFLWLAFREVEFEKIVEAARGASFWWLIPFSLTTLFAHFCRAERWRLLINDTEHRPNRFTLFTGVMFGYLANIPFARLGEVTRPVYVAQQIGESNSKMIGTIVLERIIDSLTLMALMAFVVVFMVSDPQILQNLFGIDITDPEVLFSFVIAMAEAGVGLVIALVLVIIVFRALSRRFEKVHSLYEKARSIIKTFTDGILAIRNMREWPRFLFFTILIWAGYVSMTYIPFWMFDMHQVFGLTYADALILTMVSAVGIIIPTPGGVGTYHLFITQSLLLLYAVPEAIGLSYATIAHASTLLIIIVTTPILLAIDKFLLTKSREAAQGT